MEVKFTKIPYKNPNLHNDEKSKLVSPILLSGKPVAPINLNTNFESETMKVDYSRVAFRMSQVLIISNIDTNLKRRQIFNILEQSGEHSIKYLRLIQAQPSKKKNGSKSQIMNSCLVYFQQTKSCQYYIKNPLQQYQSWNFIEYSKKHAVYDLHFMSISKNLNSIDLFNIEKFILVYLVHFISNSDDDDIEYIIDVVLDTIRDGSDPTELKDNLEILETNFEPEVLEQFLKKYMRYLKSLKAGFTVRESGIYLNRMLVEDILESRIHKLVFNMVEECDFSVS